MYNYNRSIALIKQLSACALMMLISLTVAHAQPSASSSIEGRVLNVSNGSYLNNVRITVDGTTKQTFTDGVGNYRLDGLKAGSVSVTAFYTGLAAQTLTINLHEGEVAQLDFSLSASNQTISKSDIIKLDQFVVQEEKDTDQKSIAINDQRFAPNMKAVVSTDQYGDVAEGNVGEFLKYLPGVALDYTSPDARQIMLRGVSPIYTSVTVDGNNMASAASSGSNRFFELEQASINNVSRMEVVFSRTPDISAAALGGSVNMISKSAFELNHKQTRYRVYESANGDNLTFGSTVGPFNHPSNKIKPGFDFSYANPVSKNFGFTISYIESHIFYPQHRSQPTWAPVANGAGATFANPFLRSYQMQDGPKNTDRRSIGTTFDWRLSDTNRFSIRPQWNYYDGSFGNRNITWNVQGTSNTAPVSWSPDYVNGATGAGNVAQGTSFRDKYGFTGQIDTNFEHRGSVWTFTAGTSYSHASNHYHDSQHQHFENVGLNRYGLTTNFGGIQETDSAIKPSLIQTFDKTTGAPVDWSQLSNYYLTTANFNENDSIDLYRSVHMDLKRGFSLFGAETQVKVGGLLQDHMRDIRKPTITYNFIGPNGKQTTSSVTDAGDSAANYNLVDVTSAPPFNFNSVQWVSPWAVYNLFTAHPEYFQYNSSNIATDVQNSQHIDELITAGYLMGDTSMLNNRLRFVYGVRFERTRDIGDGYLKDTNAIYQKDSSGNVILTNGKPTVLTGPNGLALTDASNAILASNMQYKDRGLRNTTQYAAGYPSINMTFNVTSNLIFRLAYAKALGRPDFGNIIPGTSIPDPSSSTPYAITVKNSALAPEKSDNYDAALEYYFSKVGVFSVSVYRKDFSNFFGTLTLPDTAALLNQYDIPNPNYYLTNNGTITSTFNVGRARVQGIQLNYNQMLTFLPVKGFSIFATGYANHMAGTPLADFTNFIARVFNTGISYDQRRFGAKLNFNYRGQERMGMTQYTDSTGAKMNGYEYYKARPYWDLNFDYRLTPRVGLFLAGRNFTNVIQDDQKYAVGMPGYMHLARREEFGAQYTAGIKGSF